MVETATPFASSNEPPPFRPWSDRIASTTCSACSIPPTPISTAPSLRIVGGYWRIRTSATRTASSAKSIWNRAGGRRRQRNSAPRSCSIRQTQKDTLDAPRCTSGSVIRGGCKSGARRALMLDPQHAAAHYALGSSLVRLGHVDEERRCSGVPPFTGTRPRPPAIRSGRWADQTGGQARIERWGFHRSDRAASAQIVASSQSGGEPRQPRDGARG